MSTLKPGKTLTFFAAIAMFLVAAEELVSVNESRHRASNNNLDLSIRRPYSVSIQISSFRVRAYSRPWECARLESVHVFPAGPRSLIDTKDWASSFSRFHLRT